jgi:hypothetical protein
MRIYGACPEHIFGLGSEFSVGPGGANDCSAYLLLRDLRAEVLRKFKFFKTADLVGFRRSFRLRMLNKTDADAEPG